MAAPSPSLTTSESYNIPPGKNIPAIADENSPGDSFIIKPVYFKLGTGAAGSTQSIAEVITKNPEKLQLNNELLLDDGNFYFVQQLDRTPVKFASGSPLVTQKTSINFPSPDIEGFIPEKVATFLIFKK
jgi:hypothetical protein